MTPNVTVRTYPDPYDFIIGVNMLTIEFYGYQNIVNYTSMDNCLGDANDEVIEKVLADQDNEPMGTDPHVWSSGDVSLHLVPYEHLTWGRWSLVPVAIGRFVTENGLRGTQFIILWHELGPIGYGQLVASSELHSITPNAAATVFRIFMM